MKTKLFLLLLLYSFNSIAQKPELQYRDIDYYFIEVARLEIGKLIKMGVLIDSTTIAEEYLDKETNRLNEAGFDKYAYAKMEVYQTYFRDCLYQQHLKYNNNVYGLYFSMAGFDDIGWYIIKWDEKDWKNEERINLQQLEKSKKLKEIAYNYDEGPKNLENVNIFIKNDYLVMEREGLYHSLYDLKTDSLLINLVCPLIDAGTTFNDKEAMNKWIKENLHAKIESIISEERK